MSRRLAVLFAMGLLALMLVVGCGQETEEDAATQAEPEMTEEVPAGDTGMMTDSAMYDTGMMEDSDMPEDEMGEH